MWLLIDENVPFASARALRAAGHDVFSACSSADVSQLLMDLFARPARCGADGSASSIDNTFGSDHSEAILVAMQAADRTWLRGVAAI